jgi:mono/diheme cytochrome c family protein
MTALKLLLLALMAALAGAIGFAYSGAFNVAADNPHWPLTASLMETTRDRSIALRARDVEAPPALGDASLIAMGAEHYSEMCTECHLAPGMAETEIRAGLNPKPPELAKLATRRTPAQAFWIIKHGLKMTGMPAWGATHDDRSVWALVAFLQKLPELSRPQYEALVAEGGRGEHSHAEEGTGEHPEPHVHAEGDEHEHH